uniref:Ig-like domain-containing protein n=1 Tax=Neogobius melanostomus TaxID=47308 RepID=A0A8C6U6A6_9GOBI
MVDALLVLFLCGVMPQEIIQPEGFKTAKLGQTVDIKCFTDSDLKKRVWYKLGSNRRLQLLASANSLFKPNAPIDDHYTVSSSETENTLTIKDITVKDVGTYFCGIHSTYDVDFGPGTVLEIKGESEPVQSVLQSPEYISAKPGDSVTLSCSFTSRHCPREHISVMWVRSGSTSSGIVSWDYINKNICEKTEEASCVHNLSLKDIGSAEDGTYLCMVTACGDTLIGNVTRIRLYGNKCFLSNIQDSIIFKDFYLSRQTHELISPNLVLTLCLFLFWQCFLGADQSEVSSTLLVLTVSNVVFGVAVVVLVWVVCWSHRKELVTGTPFTSNITSSPVTAESI